MDPFDMIFICTQSSPQRRGETNSLLTASNLEYRPSYVSAFLRERDFLFHLIDSFTESQYKEFNS